MGLCSAVCKWTLVPARPPAHFLVSDLNLQTLCTPPPALGWGQSGVSRGVLWVPGS